MKAITEARNGDVIDSKQLEEVVFAVLDDVDYYDGRNVEYVLTNLLRSYGRLIDVLAEKEVLNVEDINNIIVGAWIDRLEK